MKRKHLYSAMLVLSFLLIGIQPALAQDEEGLQMLLEESQLPGKTEGTGTYFKVTDSEYLNITLESSEPIHLILESVPEMVIMDFEAAGGATSTEITLTGLLFSTTYYKYEDDYHNGVTFTTDVNGIYTYTQDLSEPHLVFIQPQASTIFIPTDTSVGTWDPVTRTYTLTTDVYETIQIDEDNLTLDGAGHTVTGADIGSGVYLYKRAGVAVTNLNVQKFTWGIHLYKSNNNTLTGNTANSNKKFGINLGKSSNNTLTNNTASNNSYGIGVSRSSNNTLTGNTMSDNRFNFRVDGWSDSDFDNSIDTTNTVDGKPIYYVKNTVGGVYDSSINAGVFYAISCEGITIKDLTLTNNGCGISLWKTHNSRIENVLASNNEYGIRLKYSSNNTLAGNTTSNNSISGIEFFNSSGNTLRNNTMSGNQYNFGLSGSSDPDFDNDIDTSNTVDGKPIYYVKDTVGGVYDSSTNAGTFYAINCEGITIRDLTLTDNLSGVFLWKTRNSNIENITASKNNRGISLQSSNDNTLTNNTANSNGKLGIGLYNSSNNTLTNDTANSNKKLGIGLDKSSGNTLTNNTANSNKEFGIELIKSSGNTLINNTASNNRLGIFLERSSNNTLIDNTANSNKKLGIGLEKSSSNNTLIDNTGNSNNDFGIRLKDYCHNNTLTGNTANSNNWCGIELEYSSNNTLTDNTANSNEKLGIWLGKSHNNTLTDNTANSNNKYGISLSKSNNNTLTNNTISLSNECGIYLFESSDNQIYNNNFINNTTQAYVEGGSDNVFNLAKPTGGNFWSDWTSPDADGDGFVDYPYVFTGGIDYLPWTRRDGWFNQPPIADAGGPYEVECACNTPEGTQVMLDGSGSSDPDGDPLTYTWTGPFVESPASGPNPTVTLTGCVGEYLITLIVNDGQVDSEPDTAVIKVVDTTPPAILSVSASPNTLWPPNHKMVEVAVSMDTEDLCDPAPVCNIVNVTSNEPINGQGDGNTEPDWEITGDLTVKLRAERSGGGTGRVYTIHVECKDASGNTATGAVEVTVPHDRGKGKK